MIRPAAGRVPAGLRAILGGAWPPTRPTATAAPSELAEDLDRWRTDRSLAYAEEPRLPSVLAAGRAARPAMAAAAVGLAVALTAAALAWHSAGSTRKGVAEREYAQIFDERRSRRVPRPADHSRHPQAPPPTPPSPHDGTWSITASSATATGGAATSSPGSTRSAATSWRSSCWSSRCGTPAPWARRRSRDDWRRALFCLGRVTDAPFPPLQEEASVLRRRLRMDDPPAPAPPAPPPFWMNEYLLGVASELRNDTPGRRDALATTRPS